MFKVKVLGAIACCIFSSSPILAEAMTATASIKQEKYIERKGLSTVPNIAILKVVGPGDPKASQAKHSTLAFTTDEVTLYNHYLSALRTRIQKNWTPLAPIGNKKTSVILKINHDGMLETSTYAKMCKNAYFNASAIDAINLSSPFDPLPTDDNDLAIRITFDKTLVASEKLSKAASKSKGK